MNPKRGRRVSGKPCADKAGRRGRPCGQKTDGPIRHPRAEVASKHPCPDCFYCQGCSQDRCRLCRSVGKSGRSKLSLAEQIRLYDRINRLETPRQQRRS